MLKMLKRFIREDEGLEWVEWSLAAALIITAVMLTFTSIGSEVDTRFNSVLTAIQAG